MKRILAALVPLTLALGLAACTAASGSGNSNGGSQPRPSYSVSFLFPDAPSTAPLPPRPQPSVQIDAAPTGDSLAAMALGKCNLYLDPASTNGLIVTDGIHLDGRVNIRCSVPPTLILLVIKLQFFHGGVWVDEITPPYTSTRLPLGGNIPQVHIVSTLCYPGPWRMEISVSGVSYDGHTTFGMKRATKTQRIAC